VSEQIDRAAKIREIAKKHVVWKPPGTDSLPAPRDLTYRSASGSALAMRIYHPASSPTRHVPVVLAPLAYPDPEGGVRMFGPVTSWAEVFAASGMAAVVYGSDAPERDVHAALKHLRTEGAAHGLDANRSGLFAASGNVTVALSALMNGEDVRCAALLCGYTMDLNGSTAVADMSAQAGFVNACAGRSVDDLPSAVPTLFVRAGRDQFAGLNETLDTVVMHALARNLPLTLINHASGAHGFDVDEDSDASRRIIRQVIAFLQNHLGVFS
jgi:hypothetical protein